ncbi:MAG: transposase [Nitrospinaceae bacterium]|nr:transposase [Nitrospinaceae bacterium]
MARKRYSAEQIIGYLREAAVLLAKGSSIPQICKKIGIAEQTYYRWRKEYGSLSVDQAKRSFPLVCSIPSILDNRCSRRVCALRALGSGTSAFWPKS